VNSDYLVGIQIAPTRRRTVEIWRKVKLNCIKVKLIEDSFSSLEVIFYNYWHRMGKKRGERDVKNNRKRKAVCVSKETIFVFVGNYTFRFSSLRWLL
jgi:hypothetical protein